MSCISFSIISLGGKKPLCLLCWVAYLVVGVEAGGGGWGVGQVHGVGQVMEDGVGQVYGGGTGVWRMGVGQVYGGWEWGRVS